MRTAALRPLLVVALTGIAALGAASPAGAHGGTTIAEGGGDGVKILVNAAETQTPAGREAIDVSTTIEGRGTGEGATVTYWIRPAGGETFRATTTRDAAGIAHTDVPTADRGDWRSWDVSAVVRLSTGERLRVSNAEANPPGPDPAATAGGGATGADGDEQAASGDDAPASGGTSPGTATDTTTGEAPATTTDDTAAAGPEAGEGRIVDVSGEEDGAPWWAIASVPLILIAAIGLIVLGRRRAAAEAARGNDYPPGD
ncbi:hypothetical protein [Patulibacter sp.]|uniref:hypothetical protein n=1 Tax=Patulibacter sp. TaxID=1912859 RepID=UPI00271C6533|nr:hypothetical protein [Patulibacter sp.]MDO9410173.1 hypothetical protein [Patulibacter sp.]